MSSILSLFLRFWWVLAITLIGIIALWVVFIVLPPERQILSRQFVLYQSIEKKKWEDLSMMVHPDYEDAWGYDRDKMILVLQDARTQFITLSIDAPDPVIEINDEQATASAVISLRGFGGTGSQMIKERMDKLDAPFVFEWEQTGKGRKGWLLRRISNEALNIPSSYEPGSVKDSAPDL